MIYFYAYAYALHIACMHHIYNVCIVVYAHTNNYCYILNFYTQLVI